MAAAGVIADFDLPPDLEAAEPPEARGLARDDVRLLISDVARDAIAHAHFRDLPQWLSPGDLLVVNSSATINAALQATTGGVSYDVHLSTRLRGGLWSVELRRFEGLASHPCRDARSGMVLQLPAGGRATLLGPYPPAARAPSRLWMAALDLPAPLHEYCRGTGSPFATATSPSRGRWRCTRQSSPASRGAPKCRRPAGRSPPSSSVGSKREV